MRAYVVSGPAAAGKSTLGLALARRTRAVLLDLDTATNPLLEALFAGRQRHWNDDSYRPLVRPARYAVLRDLAAAQVAIGLDVVLVAPFTVELTGGPEWRDLASALAPADVHVAWLTTAPDALAARRADRADPRDAVDISRPTDPPALDHVEIDATLPTEVQLDRFLRTVQA